MRDTRRGVQELMRKFIRLLIAALVAATMIVPATAATATECGALRGVARLQVFDTPVGGLIGQGSAVVRFGGEWERVTFDETNVVDLGGGSFDVTHVWHFGDGDATFLEHSAPQPIPGTNLLRFRSPVDVSPSGTALYNGIFDLDTKVAWFTVQGNICVAT